MSIASMLSSVTGLLQPDASANVNPDLKLHLHCCSRWQTPVTGGEGSKKTVIDFKLPEAPNPVKHVSLRTTLRINHVACLSHPGRNDKSYPGKNKQTADGSAERLFDRRFSVSPAAEPFTGV